ncbi:MAG: glutamate--tRNA ligase [Defluviitaleaceae bacterium]|nr:glutamate--tRNA ligase [Defluviitaleaceae bacterium]
MRTRFAPSPTGFMHIGNLRSALFGYLLARKMGGVFALRIEDTDQERLVEGAVEKIYETLKIAGITHDEGPDVGGDFGPYIQSQRENVYMKYAQQLLEGGHAYRCFCDKEADPADCPCQNIEGDAAKPHVVRQAIPAGQTTFVDEVFGEITVENEELENQVLIKSDGFPTYNFANVVDDHLMAITHVMRGSEYLPSTPKYNLLYKAFGWEVPTYVHLPLILSADGGKLSKRRGDAFFEDFLEAGFLPEAIVNYIALLGWSPPENREIYSLSELEQIFSVEGLSKSPSTFDLDKLKWMNGEYLKAMDGADFLPLALPYIDKVAQENVDKTAIASLVKDRIATLAEIPELLDFVAQLPDYDTALFVNQKNKVDEEVAKDMLSKFLPEIEGLEEWTGEVISAFLKSFAQAHGAKPAQIMWPLRCALSGKETSPGGATDLLVIFGKEESVNRIKTALSKLG